MRPAAAGARPPATAPLARASAAPRHLDPAVVGPAGRAHPGQLTGLVSARVRAQSLWTANARATNPHGDHASPIEEVALNAEELAMLRLIGDGRPIKSVA